MVSVMSKAFTRASDNGSDEPVAPKRLSSLPPGAKNYITADGALRLRQELDRLISQERPSLSRSLADADAKRQLKMLDQRIAHLQQSLQSAVVVPPPSEGDERVQFGTVVTVRDAGGNESRYRIVGIDEVDIERGWISWLSPIAKALLNSRLGQRVRFKTPAGDEEWLIVAVTHE
jgi:transcription elongation factor GreB